MSTFALSASLAAFLLVMLAIGFYSQQRIQTTEDYLVAGRRLSLSLATATLFATWFGAGTLLTATDTVRERGLSAVALEPLGPGLCLIIAGWFFARQLWGMQLLTLPDFYRRRYGPRVELVASAIMVPGYFGWIAAQFVALAGILEGFFGIPPGWGILLVAFVGTAYTLLGGMWSVTLTDAVQLVLLLVGVGIIGGRVLGELGAAGGIGAGWARLMAETPPEMLTMIPTENLGQLVGWISVLCIGALGNLPGQDLGQRIFSARSAGIAVRACHIAGFAYILVGAVPVLSGLAAELLFESSDATSTLPALAARLLSPGLGIVFILALVAAVMSTIDSALLAPASVLSHNILARVWPARSGVTLGRAAVLAVSLFSLGAAYMGQSAYELLESAYAIGMVGLFVPLALGIHSRRGGAKAALAAMIVGTGVWGLHLLLGWESFGGTLLGEWQVPQELAATLLAWAAYEVAARKESRYAPDGN